MGLLTPVCIVMAEAWKNLEVRSATSSRSIFRLLFDCISLRFYSKRESCTRRADASTSMIAISQRKKAKENIEKQERPWQCSWRYWDLSCFSTVAVGGVAQGALNAKHSLLLLRLELRTLEVPSSISSTTSSCEKPSRMSSELSPQPLRLVSRVSEPLLQSDPG